MNARPATAADPAGGLVAAIVLAGGLSRRMGGGDKCLQLLGGRPLLAHVIARIRPQVDRLALNANGDPVRFSAWNLPVVPDSIAGFAGPLAGVLTGLDWIATELPASRWLVSVPGDAPFLPVDLVARLFEAIVAQKADMACASSGGRRQFVVALWPVSMREGLRRALAEEGVRKVEHWLDRHRLAVVDFPDDPVDPFFNVNSADDLSRAETLLAAQTGAR